MSIYIVAPTSDIYIQIYRQVYDDITSSSRITAHTQPFHEAAAAAKGTIPTLCFGNVKYSSRSISTTEYLRMWSF